MAVLAKHNGLYCECQGKINTEKIHSAISLWNGCSVWACLRLACLDCIVQVDLLHWGLEAFRAFSLTGL